MIIEQAGGKFRTGCMLILFIFIGMLLLFRWGCSGKNISQESRKMDIRLILENTEFIKALGNLELAERTTTEIIERIESKKVAMLPESKAIYEVRFKVRYTYFVDGSPDKWKIWEKEGIAYVEAPLIKAGEPSVDSSSVTGTYKGGYMILEEKKKLEEFKSTVSEVARQRSMDKQEIDLIRETCRRSLERFFMQWFNRYGIETKAVLVKFSDEECF